MRVKQNKMNLQSLQYLYALFRFIVLRVLMLQRGKVEQF